MKILATLLATIACALPAAAQYDETAKSFHLLPHLADGGGWQSVLLVTNVSQSASSCTFNVYGVPLNRFRDFDLTGSTATFQLEGFGGYLIWGTKNELAAVASGYATLDCSVPVVAQVVFASYDGLGVTAAATVFSAQAATVFQFPVLQPQRRLAPVSISFDSRLGFAIANDTNAEASCRIVLEDYQRTNLGEATLSVPAKSNLGATAQRRHRHSGNIPRRDGDRFVQSAGRDDRTAFRAAGRNDHHLQHAATGDSLHYSGIATLTRRHWRSMEPTQH